MFERRKISSLFLLLCGTLSLTAFVPEVARAEQQGDSPLSQAQQPPNQSFWIYSQELIWEQFQVIQLLEGAMILTPEGSAIAARIDPRLAETPRAERLRVAREQLWFHLKNLDRFLSDRYIMPQFLCRDGLTLPPNISPEQQQVYCSLYYAYEQLEPLVPLLDRHISLLAPVEPLLPSPSLRSIPLGAGNSGTGLSPLERPSAPLIVGQPAKGQEAEEDNRAALAIPNAQAIYAIETSRQLLLTAQNAFPPDFAPPRSNQSSIRGRFNYAALYPQEAERYEAVLSQPNTGIAAILNAPPSPLDLNQLRDRLYPVSGESLPLVPLDPLAYGFIPRLALQIDGEEFAIAADSLTYGFMVDLGDIDLEAFPDLEDLDSLSTAERQFFLDYRPPKELQAIQVEQRRFLFGKLGMTGFPEAEPLAIARIPAQLDRTYLLRLIQYQLPDAILNDEPIPRSRRRHTDRLLETPSSDLLIAFRPIRRDADGSYTVLWKIIDRFPQPEIIDLEDYVYFQ